MDDDMAATHLENLDRRLARVEQILPTLATKEELRLTVAGAVAPLAIKEELRATEGELRLAIAAAVAPLATKDEIRELRRHMDVLSEDLRGDIRILTEHLSTVMSRLSDG